MVRSVRPQTCTPCCYHIPLSNVISLHHITSHCADRHRHQQVIIIERRHHRLVLTSTRPRLHRFFITHSEAHRVLHSSEEILILVKHTTKLYVFHKYLLILRCYDHQSCRFRRDRLATPASINHHVSSISVSKWS